MRITVLIIILYVLAIACKPNSKKTEVSPVENNHNAEQTAIINSNISGNYVSNAYTERAEGFYYVAASIKPN